MKEVVIVGSGNVAYSLSIALAKSSDYKVIGIVSRNESKGKSVASLCGSIWSSLNEPLIKADIYIIAVSDSAIEQVAKIILPQMIENSIICHTSAIAPLINCDRECVESGRFYPLQTFSKNIEADFKKITIFVESKYLKTEQILVALSGSISKSHKVVKMGGLEKIHLAATFANNFTNRMYHHAEEILSECGLERDILYPLIEEGVRKLKDSTLKVKYLQTGAAVRGDDNTINRHIEMLNPKKRAIYDLITKDIRDDKL